MPEKIRILTRPTHIDISAGVDERLERQALVLKPDASIEELRVGWEAVIEQAREQEMLGMTVNLAWPDDELSRQSWPEGRPQV